MLSKSMSGSPFPSFTVRKLLFDWKVQAPPSEWDLSDDAHTSVKEVCSPQSHRWASSHPLFQTECLQFSLQNKLCFIVETERKLSISTGFSTTGVWKSHWFTHYGAQVDSKLPLH